MACFSSFLDKKQDFDNLQRCNYLIINCHAFLSGYIFFIS